MTTQYVSYRPGGGGGGSIAIGGAVSGGTDTAVLFIHPSGILAQDATNLSFNSSTGRLTLGVGPTITAFSTAGIVHNSSAGLLTSSLVVNADVSTTAAVARTKLASGTNYRILANSSLGVMSENAALTAGQVVYPDANGQLTGEAALSYNAASDTLSTVNIVGSSSGNISYPGGSGSEHFGLNSSAGGTGSVAVGAGADAGLGGLNVAIGANAIAGDARNIVIGNAASATLPGGMAIGYSASSSEESAIAIGTGSSANAESSIVLGIDASANGIGGIAIGQNSSSAADSYSIVVGADASASSAANSIAIGGGASVSGDNQTVIGASATANSGNSVVIGYGASAANGIAIGYGATSTQGIAIGADTTAAQNQFIAGSPTRPITSVFLGSGVNGATPSAVTINATGGAGTNVAGANLTLAAGIGSGSATPASVKIQSTTAGSTGTTAQTLSDVASFSSSGVTLSKQALQLNPFTTGTGNTSEIRFMELAANGTNFVGFKAPDSIAADKVWVLPNVDGSGGQVLSTNGSLVLSWASVLTDPMTTRGDIIARNSSNVTARLAVGAAGTRFRSDGTDPSWIYGTATTKSAGYTLVAGDEIVTVTAAATITLPTAVGITGKIYEIVNLSTAAADVTVNTTSAQTIGGRASGDIILRRYTNFLRVKSDGSNWQIIGKQEHQVLTSSSGQGLSGATGSYQGAAPNVTLGIGEWEVTGRIAWNYGASSTGASLNAETGFYGANGANNTSVPTAITAQIDGPTTFNDMASGFNLFPNQAGSGNFSSPELTTRIIVVSGTQAVFFVPKAAYSVAGTQSFVGYINARRIW